MTQDPDPTFNKWAELATRNFLVLVLACTASLAAVGTLADVGRVVYVQAGVVALVAAVDGLGALRTPTKLVFLGGMVVWTVPLFVFEPASGSAMSGIITLTFAYLIGREVDRRRGELEDGNGN